MKKPTSLSRRESLLGIGTAGTLLGGAAIGISSVMASDDDDEKNEPNDDDTEQKAKDKDEDKNSETDDHDSDSEKNGTADDNEDTDGDDEKGDRFSLVPVCHEPDRAQFRVENHGKDDADVTWKVNDTDKSGTLTVPTEDSESFWVKADDGAVKVTLYHDGTKVATQKGASKEQCEAYALMDKIELEAVCYKPAKHDDDGDDHDDDGDSDDSESGDEDYDPDGETIEDGEEVDDDDNGDDDNGDNGDNGYDDGDNGYDDGDDGDDKERPREGMFRVHNHSKQDVKLDWRVESDKQGGKLAVPDKGATDIWVTLLDDQKTSVTLSYEGTTIATKKANTDTKCETDCPSDDNGDDDNGHDGDDDNGYDDD